MRKWDIICEIFMKLMIVSSTKLPSNSEIPNFLNQNFGTVLVEYFALGQTNSIESEVESVNTVVFALSAKDKLPEGFFLNLAYIAGISKNLNKEVILYTQDVVVSSQAAKIPNVKIAESLNDLKKVLSDYLIEKNVEQDLRFNFFLSPKLSNYLDWVAKNKKVSRSVYLRHLIDAQIAQAKK